MEGPDGGGESCTLWGVGHLPGSSNAPFPPTMYSVASRTYLLPATNKQGAAEDSLFGAAECWASVESKPHVPNKIPLRRAKEARPSKYVMDHPLDQKT